VNVIKISEVDTEQFLGAQQFAFDQICKLAQSQNVDKLVAVSHAHLVGSYWSGNSQIELLLKLVQLQGCFSIRTTTSASSACMKLTGVSAEPQRARAEQVAQLLVQLGAEPTFTCAPYHLAIAPSQGDCIAWAESNAVVYANSVIGARTAKTPQFVDLMAALCGYVPYTGLYTDEGRRPNVFVNVEPNLLKTDVDYQLFGLWLGEVLVDQIPLIIADVQPTPDQLRGLGANTSTTGNIAMFHWLDVTPEAGLYKSQAAVVPHRTYLASNHREMQRRYANINQAEISAICIGAPHASFDESSRFIGPFLQANSHSVTPVFISTSRAVYDHLAMSYDLNRLHSLGVVMVLDSCTYYPTALSVKLRGAVATNSGKWAHYARSNWGVDTAVADIEELVQLAMLQSITVLGGY